MYLCDVCVWARRQWICVCAGVWMNGCVDVCMCACVMRVCACVCVCVYDGWWVMGGVWMCDL